MNPNDLLGKGSAGGSMPPMDEQPMMSAPPRSFRKIKDKIQDPVFANAGMLLIAVGVFLGWIPPRVALAIGTAFGIYSAWGIYKNNPMSMGFKLRQLTTRVMMVLCLIFMLYIIGINAEPYRIILNNWNPPSFWDRFNVGRWLNSQIAGYVFWGIMQLGETYLSFMCADSQSLDVLIADIKAKQGDQSNPLGAVGKIMDAPLIFAFLGVMVFTYLIDGVILITSYPPFEMGVMQLDSLALLAAILFGFQFFAWLFLTLRSHDLKMQVRVQLERAKS